MNRRRFAFWIGMGLFGAAERLNAEGLDALAASLMEATEEATPPPAPIPAGEPAAIDMPVHWQATHNNTWRWVQREHFEDGEWRLTGMTTPVRRDTGEPLEGVEGYLAEEDVPDEFRATVETITDPDDELFSTVDEGVATREDVPGPDAASHRQARHGRPPSRWLRSLEAAELSLWLATVEPPEAGVAGMTFEEHLTRDHRFDADRIAGLTEEEMAKLHAAAHHGY